MARPEEKSQSMLHRYLRSRAGDDGVPGGGSGLGRPRARRPHLATLCEDVDEAERWRRQVLRDASRKVGDIQNPSLGDERTRELNDEINKLLRERRHWERRIRELGGRSYPREEGGEGALVHKGYHYFGAARELPGVAALVESERPVAETGEFDDTPIEDLLRRVDPARYYGYEDAELAAREVEREAGDRRKIVEAWDGRESGEEMAWDKAVWEGAVGVKPLEGAELEAELARIELEERKIEALALVDRA